VLVLSRRVGEEVVIGDNIRVTVLDIRGNQVRLGFTAPGNIVIRRSELPDQMDPSCEQDPGRPYSPP
jgi:carbon storage regulator